MQHPFERIPPTRRKRTFVLLFALTLVVMIVMNMTGVPLQTDAAPQGIVSFEFAGNASKAQEILDSWDAEAQAHAGFNLGFDFVFLLAYSTTIAFACAWLASALRGWRQNLATVGLWLAWGQSLAALLDVVENAALTTMLLGSVKSPWPQVAWLCALPKFVLVFLGLAFVVLGVVLQRIVRPDRFS